jgi:AcrR family transcriptional regulator
MAGLRSSHPDYRDKESASRAGNTSAVDAPLTRDRILATAEEVIRRFGPDKATLVDVARALGVSHAAVYRHVASKAELRDLVVGRWIEATMPALRTIVARPGPAPQRLRRLSDALIAGKRRRASDDPELFAAYRTLAANAKTVAATHIDELIGLTAQVIRSGIEEGAFRPCDHVAAAKAVLFATSRFHHPVHAGEWGEPGIDQTYNDVWQLLMDGLCMAKSSEPPRKIAHQKPTQAPKLNPSLKSDRQTGHRR